MRKITIITLALMMVISVAVTPVSAYVNGSGMGQMDSEEKKSDITISPGEQMGAIIAVQQETINGDVEEREFNNRLENANESEKADIINERVNSSFSDRERIEEEIEEIEEEYEDGNISEGQYYARMTVIDKQIDNVNKSAQSSSNASNEIGMEKAEKNGVNVDKIEELRNNASEMKGEEISNIAKEIGGEKSNNRGEKPNDRGEKPNDRGEKPNDRGEKPNDRGGEQTNEDGNESDTDRDNENENSQEYSPIEERRN